MRRTYGSALYPIFGSLGCWKFGFGDRPPAYRFVSSAPTAPMTPFKSAGCGPNPLLWKVVHETLTFLREVLAGGRPGTREELEKAASDRSLNFEGKNPGRVLHFALLGMAQNGIVEMVSKGVGHLKLEDPRPFSERNSGSIRTM